MGLSIPAQLSLEIAPAGVAAPLVGICGYCDQPIPEARPGQRYCCGACRAAAYDAEHPRLAAPVELGRRREGTIQARLESLLSDGRQRTAAELAYELREGADTVARELRKLAAKQPRLHRVARGGHQRAVWFLVSA